MLLEGLRLFGIMGLLEPNTRCVKKATEVVGKLCIGLRCQAFSKGSITAAGKIGSCKTRRLLEVGIQTRSGTTSKRPGQKGMRTVEQAS